MYALKRIAPFGVVALALMLALALGALAMFGGSRAEAVTGPEVTPSKLAGNVNCVNLTKPPPSRPLPAGTKEIRIQSPTSGTFAGPNGTPVPPGTNASVTLTVNGAFFDFTANGISIVGVLVKGGPDTNFYNYVPLGGVTTDDGLSAPINPSTGQPFGLSHISFCYVETGSVEIIKTDDAGQPLAGAKFTL